MIAIPRYVALDTSILGKVALDFASKKISAQARARQLIEDLCDRNVYVVLSSTHVAELLRHRNIETVRQRYWFLQSLPLIAWIRPRDNSWFVGSFFDLFVREFKLIASNGITNFSQIRELVVQDAFQTGIGTDLFQDDTRAWDQFRQLSIEHQSREMLVASVTHIDPAKLETLTLKQLAKRPHRSREEILAFAPKYKSLFKEHLEKFGDDRLQGQQQIANNFVSETIQRVMGFEKPGKVHPEEIAKIYGVPLNLVRDNMTLEEFSELCSRTSQIKSILKKIGIPPNEPQIEAILLNSFSHRLEWLLRRAQRRHPRATGSNLGDSHIASISFYLDAIHVDKRTAGFLAEIGRRNPAFKECSSKCLSVGNYEMIPCALDKILTAANKSLSRSG